jgi:hypothetical protein
MAQNVPGKVCEGIVYKNNSILVEASLRFVPRPIYGTAKNLNSIYSLPLIKPLLIKAVGENIG